MGARAGGWRGRALRQVAGRGDDSRARARWSRCWRPRRRAAPAVLPAGMRRQPRLRPDRRGSGCRRPARRPPVLGGRNAGPGCRSSRCSAGPNGYNAAFRADLDQDTVLVSTTVQLVASASTSAASRRRLLRGAGLDRRHRRPGMSFGAADRLLDKLRACRKRWSPGQLNGQSRRDGQTRKGHAWSHRHRSLRLADRDRGGGPGGKAGALRAGIIAVGSQAVKARELPWTIRA